jgi:hypothetical protein
MRLLCLCVLSLQCLLGFAQPEVDLNKVYILTQPAKLTKCNAVGEPTDNETEIALRGFEFKIDIVRASDFVIHFIKWRKDVEKNNQFYNTKSRERGLARIPTAADVFFILPLTEFNKSIMKFGNAPFAVGILVVPIKMRFGNGEQEIPENRRYFAFESAVSLGFSIGVNIKLDKSKFTARNNLAILTGVSLSSVPVDSFTTKGYLSSSTNSASITWHLGVLYQIDNFQIGLFTGMDFLAGELGRQWKYKEKPWFGIGLGYSMFKARRTTDTQD